MSTKITPILKWAGGKRQLLPVITPMMPKQFHTYYEPFLGAGALFCDIQPSQAVINDVNKQLMNMYMQIKDKPTEVCSIISEIETKYNSKTTKEEKDEYYYEVRGEFNEVIDQEGTPLSAALLIFLNKAGFNGMYRVNASGKYNIPSGHKKTVHAYDWENIDGWSKLLKNTNIMCCDFEESCSMAKEKDFVFLDSPYYNTFDTYQAGGFDIKDHERLAELYKKLSNKGIYCMLTNSNTDFIKNLYKDFHIKVVDVKRMINRNADGRTGKEVIITNYGE